MRPPTRQTRTTNAPGLVDLPKPRKSTADVTAEKKKKKEAAVTKAKVKDTKATQVARVEKEMRVAQREAIQMRGQVGKVGRTKRTFERETPAKETEKRPSPPLKRKAGMAEVFEEPGRARSSKAARTILASDSEEAPSSSQPTVAKPRGLTVAQRRIILASDSEEAPSSSQPTIAKPRGLATARHHAPAVNTVISDFEYEQEGSGSGSEEEDEEDNLEYPGDGSESLVSIKSATTSNAPSQTSQTAGSSRAGVRSLPSVIRRSFSMDFVPAILEELGCSRTPWKNPDLDTIQACVNEVYPGLEYIVEKGDTLELSANARVMAFRNIISQRALAHVQAFIKTLGEDAQAVEAYVRSAMIYHGEIPFTYKTFKPTMVPASKKKEKGGYVVVRQGAFQNQMVLDTAITYYGKRGIKQYLPTAPSAGRKPIGMLALVCTAIERALLMHSTGTFILDGRAFSEVNWGHRTPVYAKLAGDMTDSQWERFYAGLGYTEAINEKLKECSRPVQHWTDDPNEYFIVGSEPAEGDEDGQEDEQDEQDEQQ